LESLKTERKRKLDSDIAYVHVSLILMNDVAERDLIIIKEGPRRNVKQITRFVKGHIAKRTQTAESSV